MLGQQRWPMALQLPADLADHPHLDFRSLEVAVSKASFGGLRRLQGNAWVTAPMRENFPALRRDDAGDAERRGVSFVYLTRHQHRPE